MPSNDKNSSGDSIQDRIRKLQGTEEANVSLGRQEAERRAEQNAKALRELRFKEEERGRICRALLSLADEFHSWTVRYGVRGKTKLNFTVRGHILTEAWDGTTAAGGERNGGERFYGSDHFLLAISNSGRIYRHWCKTRPYISQSYLWGGTFGNATYCRSMSPTFWPLGQNRLKGILKFGIGGYSSSLDSMEQKIAEIVHKSGHPWR